MNLDRLRKVAEAATPGPWRWGGWLKGPMYLCTVDRGRRFVMQFDRLGMRDAQPVFQQYDVDGKSLGMVQARELAVRERDYRDDIIDIDNPDARFMAAADPTVVLALLDVAEAAEAHYHHVTDEWERVNAGPLEPEPWDRWEAERERLIEVTADALDRLREVTGC
jgi:hypothetical protein